MWGQAFRWKDRRMCLTRVVVTMECFHWDVDKAIDQAIHRTDSYGLKYCTNPDQIPADERERLRNHALACIKDDGRVREWGRPAGMGNNQQAYAGDLLGDVITS